MNLTLYDRFKNHKNRDSAEIADILLTLCTMVDKGEIEFCAPETIFINDNSDILPEEENYKNNLYYCAHELLTQGASPDQNSAWFSFGLLIYFMREGRSYYEDKKISITDIFELSKVGESLIDSKKIPAQNETDKLFNSAMEMMTSWNPQKRSQGVKPLLEAIRNYPSVAEIDFVFDGHIIAHDNRDVDITSDALCANAKIKGTDGQKYIVLEELPLPFRPGHHRYKAHVKKAEENIEKFLFVSESSASSMIKIMKIENDFLKRDIKITRDRERTYLFYVVYADANEKRPLTKKEVYHLNVPAAASGGQYLLRATYIPDNKLTLALFDNDGIRQLSDNVMEFYI